MKIPEDTMRRLRLAKMLLESVEESLKEYEKKKDIGYLRKEDSVEAVHRRLVHARQELAVVNRTFDNACAFRYWQNFEPEEKNNGE